ncbi:uncharacterized protein CANTADRAFT_19746 [Suhomyces tanzawaensis NRRL Y-17324]|uniref:Uncharacterized protein n=1 Tax=Suhomyces tanzawaensis NRRL Y-17324 TaxID=984487 RepID=A0A1E4SRP4_9ASCO|nr:uncharacterized protein CANTADRAFT_19746 [Suhomyces tanzawaensis NRRL Y-17324]ODV82171.1 hypothetical protein CANTADRAFT_19746 [Suhomyces tanzawaensis NRRL Y-17324]
MQLPFGFYVFHSPRSPTSPGLLVEENAITELIKVMEGKDDCEMSLVAQLKLVMSLMENESNNPVVRLVSSGFFYALGNLAANGVSLTVLQLQQRLFEKMADLLLQLDQMDHETVMNVGETIDEYLSKFKEYKEIPEYHMWHLKRFLGKITLIYKKFPDLLKYWFSARTENLARADQRIFLPLEYIRKLLFGDNGDDLIFALTTLVEAADLVQVSREWLVHQSGIIRIFSQSCLKCLLPIDQGNPWLQTNNLETTNVQQYKKYLRWYFMVLQSSSMESRLVMHKQFESEFLYMIIGSSLNCQYLASLFAFIQVLGEFPRIHNIVDSILENEVLERIITQEIVLFSIFEHFILVINNLVRDNHHALIKIFGIGSEIEASPIDLTLAKMELETPRVRAMKVSIDLNYDIGQEFEFYLSNQMQSIRTYQVDVEKLIIKKYFLACIGFFVNSDNLNYALIELTKTLLLKTDLATHENFQLIMDYLYESYLSYQLELYLANARVSQAIVGTQFINPDSKLLTKLNIASKHVEFLQSARKIDTSSLSEKMRQFTVIIIHTYVVCKLKWLKSAYMDD